MNGNLVVPCCYQGGKQRISPSIVSHILRNPSINESTHYYDLCCGSGAITIELINRGVSPAKITMLDISSWGAFWKAIGVGSFSMEHFREYISNIPNDKHLIHDHMVNLSSKPASIDEMYKYLLLQASSFGGKQIWREGDIWKNAFFRAYWQPTATSVRRSPANPMQPQPEKLLERVEKLTAKCKGIECIHDDIKHILQVPVDKNSIIYIDPPYQDTTGYGFNFNLQGIISLLRSINVIEVYVSEGTPISNKAFQLKFSGANGGITGNRAFKHEEWLSACV